MRRAGTRLDVWHQHHGAAARRVSAFWNTTNSMCTPSARCRAGCRFGGARAGLSQLPDGRLAYRLKGPLPTLAVDPRSPLTRYWQPGNLIDATRVLQLNELVVR